MRIKEGNILSQYKNGSQWEIGENGSIEYSDKLNDRQGVAPELLFLEKCLNWAKDGGIIGIVMAKGQLDNREALAVRKLVCEKAQILAVVNLHEDTFEPFCGSKASVIFLKKTATPMTIIVSLWLFLIKLDKQVVEKPFSKRILKAIL